MKYIFGIIIIVTSFVLFVVGVLSTNSKEISTYQTVEGKQDSGNLNNINSHIRTGLVTTPDGTYRVFLRIGYAGITVVKVK